MLLSACSGGSTPEAEVIEPTSTPINFSGPIYVLYGGTWFTKDIADNITDVEKEMLLSTNSNKRFAPADGAKELFCEKAFGSKYCKVIEITTGEVGWIDRSAIALETPLEIDETVPTYKVTGGTWFVDDLDESILSVYKRMLLTYSDGDELFVPPEGGTQINCIDRTDSYITKTYCLVQSTKTGEIGWVEKQAIEPTDPSKLAEWNVDSPVESSEENWLTYIVTNRTGLYASIAPEDISQDATRFLEINELLKPADNAYDLSCEDVIYDNVQMTLCHVEVIETGETGWVLKKWITEL